MWRWVFTGYACLRINSHYLLAVSHCSTSARAPITHKRTHWFIDSHRFVSLFCKFFESCQVCRDHLTQEEKAQVESALTWPGLLSFLKLSGSLVSRSTNFQMGPKTKTVRSFDPWDFGFSSNISEQQWNLSSHNNVYISKYALWKPDFHTYIIRIYRYKKIVAKMTAGLGLLRTLLTTTQ